MNFIEITLSIMSLEFATTLIIIAVFIAAEIHRIRRSVSGVITDFLFDGPAALIDQRVLVRLNDGSQVKASLNGCTMCLGRLRIGDPVRVAKSQDGYVVHLPWWNSRSANSAKICATGHSSKH